ncbi:hypothetical protein KCP71_26035 [Salmonella enterica subsp. enterica]|nr:hypothetical protein KCP71_26035 [Salmonella enterica subsp. enterica]
MSAAIRYGYLKEWRLRHNTRCRCRYRLRPAIRVVAAALFSASRELIWQWIPDIPILPARPRNGTAF